MVLGAGEPVLRFCAAFAGGVLAVLPWIPLRDLRPAFFRANALLALLLALFAAGLGGGARGAGPWLWVTAGACALYAALVSTGSRLWAGVGLALALAASWGGLALHARARGASFLDLASSGLLAGSVVVTMILGHWYLVVPNLSFAHLKRLTAISAGALALRATVEALAMARAGAPEAGPLGFVFTLMRFLFGLAAPAVLFWMVWQCLKIRSNQSATGILYAMTALVLVGEVASHLLRVG